MAPRHKIDDELNESKQNALIVEIINGRSFADVGRQLAISDTSVRRWWATVPDDRRLLVAARAKQAAELAEKREAADMIVSDGDDIDNDLRWLVKRLRKTIEATEGDDDKLLELAQMREMRMQLMDIGKVRGMFNNKIDVSINLASSPQFILLRQIILTVLDRHPEAKADFLAEMGHLQVLEHARQ
ncbi:MAG: transposase-like protein [Halocynthiibacter sp.]